jgi:hypothetical protein
MSTTQEQLADLQRQQANALQQYNSQMYTTSGRNAYDAAEAQRQAQIMALQNAMMTQSQSTAPNPSAEMAANRNSIYANTEGRADQLRSDPNFATSMDFLRGVVSGQNTPYNDQVQSAMMAQNGRGTASAEAAQMGALRDAMSANGGSIYDPSYASASREAMSHRQGQNLDFAGQLAAKANLENFRAQSGAANQMAGINAGQNSQINQMLLAGTGYRAQESRSVPTGTLGTTMTTSGPISGGGATTQPSQWMGYQQVPTRQTAPSSGYTAPTPTAPRTATASPTSTFNQTQFGGYMMPAPQPQTNPNLPYGQPVAGTQQPYNAQTGIYPQRY